MQPIEKMERAVGLGIAGLADMISRGDDPNKSIPFMSMNRAARRAAIKEAKKRAKKLRK